MSKVAQLKKQAAEFEQKKQFDKALALYVKLLDSYDEFADELDVGLFNRVGDLMLRQGNVADALDYYQRASALPLISRITVPALILTARDDPFIAVEPFEGLKPPPNVAVEILPYGGHIGFVGWDGTGGVRWAESRVTDWATK